MRIKNIISMLLTVIMLFGCVSGLCAFDRSFAADDEEVLKTYEIATNEALSNAYASAAEKLAAEIGKGYASLLAAVGDYQLYANVYTGEVYYKNVKTGDVLTSNPINVDKAHCATSLQPQLLSQLAVKYMDMTGAVSTIYSYTDAAQRGQINVKQIRNGIRLEYTIGRTDTNYLIPGWITADRFEALILQPMADYILQILADEAEWELDEVKALYYSLVDAYNQNPKKAPYSAYKSGPAYAFDRLSTYELGFVVTAKAYQVAYFQYMKMRATYALQDPNSATADARSAIIASYPICGKIDNGYEEIDVVTGEKDIGTGLNYVIYTLSEGLPDKTKKLLESYVKTYCGDYYNYDEKAKDTDETGYVSSEAAPAFFRMALEYVIGSDGTLTVRLPASSIRYDSSNFTMLSIDILQYLGAGNKSEDDGYLFYPDGSGAILEFSDIRKQTSAASLTNKVYGEDYSYYEISNKHQETIRVPAFGVVDTVSSKQTDTVRTFDPTTGVISEERVTTNSKASTGYVAYLTEGESLTSLTLSFGGSSHAYATVYASFTPSPTDSYTLTDSISVSTENTEWTVVSEKKYLGNYMMKIRMLTDSAKAKTLGLTNFYDTTWVGMAQAYRDFLWKGIDLPTPAQEQLPLYIESFGSVETTVKVLSIPVKTDQALTTFGDVISMYEELASYKTSCLEKAEEARTAGNETLALEYEAEAELLSDIKNINFKLTGYANGGMHSTYPNRVKWVNAVGGKDGLNELLAYAAALEDGTLGIYPEFEFSYISMRELFDGINMKRDAARTVDNRYASKWMYDCVYQIYDSNFDIIVSPDAIANLYAKFKKSYGEVEAISGISASSLGSDLSSSFYEDNPQNREDAKSYIIGVLSDMEETYGSLMVSGGNAFVLKYADHVLGLPLDSSNYKYASRTVPFIGMVLHGYTNYTGTATNEAGDSDYHILRSLENGASLYYILSYSNTTLLKEDLLLSHYYSIRYDIWVDDLVKQYTTLNNAIGGLQDYTIVNEIPLYAERVPDSLEMNRYRNTLLSAAVDALRAEIAKANDEKVHELRYQIVLKRRLEDQTTDFIALAKADYDAKKNALSEKKTAIDNVNNAIDAYIELYAQALADGKTTAEIKADTTISNAQNQAQIMASAVSGAANWLKYESDYALAAYNYEKAQKSPQASEASYMTPYKAAYESAKFYHDATVLNRAYTAAKAKADFDAYNTGSYEDDLLVLSMESLLADSWGTVSASQHEITAIMYNAYKSGSPLTDTVGKTVMVTFDRNALIASVEAQFDRLLDELTPVAADNFREAIREAIDDVIAEYYAPFVSDYVKTLTYLNDKSGAPIYESLTDNEYGALCDALAYYYAAKTATADDASVEAFVKAYLNNANNNTKELTDIQKNVIHDVILWIRDGALNGDYSANISDITVEFNDIYTDSKADDSAEDYVMTPYTVKDNSVVVVVYESPDKAEKVEFILNFNVFDVDVRYGSELYRISSYGFCRVESN